MDHPDPKKTKTTDPDNNSAARIAAVMAKEMQDCTEDTSIINKDEIIRIVTEIQSDKRHGVGRARKYIHKYVAFAQQYPTLFNMACRPNMNMEMLTFMVSNMDEDNQEESADAVGERLAKMFAPSATTPHS